MRERKVEADARAVRARGVVSRRALLAAFALGAVLGAAGCDGGGDGGGAETGEAGKKLRVAATTTMIGDLVGRIGGERVDLKVLMGAGVDPHTFKPAPSDVGELSRAKKVFYNGLHLEGKMVELFEDKLKEKSVAVSEGVPEGRLLSWKQGEGGAHDPHIWFDVELWSMAAEKVRDGLIEADPAGADEYRRRAEEVESSLKALHAYVKQQIATIPQGRRKLITSHDAYSYFGETYGIEVLGLQGISTETEAGLANVNAAVDFIIANKIPAIFVESSVSPKTIERVRDDCRSRGFEVVIGGELFSDAMGQKGQHPGYAVQTYEGMVRYNVDTIVKALK